MALPSIPTVEILVFYTRNCSNTIVMAWLWKIGEFGRIINSTEQQTNSALLLCPSNSSQKLQLWAPAGRNEKTNLRSLSSKTRNRMIVAWEVN